MYSKSTLHLIESRPQRLNTVHKCPASLLQRSTNQITPLASTLEKSELFTASINARTVKITRITTIALESQEILESLK